MSYTITKIKTAYDWYCDQCRRKVRKLKAIEMIDYSCANRHDNKLYICYKCIGIKK